MYLWQESSRENSHCLAIELRETDAVVGPVALQVPNPDDGLPWIGPLIVGRPWQSRGLGQEAAAAIERELAGKGWPEVRLNVMTANDGARRFWERCGYHVVREDRDQDGRTVHTMIKFLRPGSHPPQPVNQ